MKELIEKLENVRDYHEHWYNGKQCAIIPYDLIEELIQALSQSEWINVEDRLPEKGEKVLIVRDVTKWDKERPIMVDIAHTGYFEKETRIGSPNALTGYHKMKGIFFAVPAILHPESVTHWMPLPQPPQTK